MVKIEVKNPNKANFEQKNNFDLIKIFELNFDKLPDGISKKEKHFVHTVFCKDSESAIRFTKFSKFSKFYFDLILPP